MSSSRRKLVLNTVSVNIGCGSCRRPKLLHIFNTKPKPKKSTYQKHKLLDHSSSSSTNTTATTFSPHYNEPSQLSEDMKSSKSVRGFGRVGTEGVAVEKDSEDPYLDFKHSMLQMILENEIYSKDDLRELLNCFLQLNSPNHHGIIVRVFTEIWNGIFSVRSNSSRFHHLTCNSLDF
ncbi:hypothetical protein TanjilG_00049 [Lupinus angustifolius]|uniref:Transcription repressor n=1 Tax=Lupinus angustifolius TaxID=3871 RepID=A0A394CY99_LUPAN|nr:PREDICTED: transcription repressor OFP6-like [Lupinus angustifolius]OIW16540.1 hypothetical protein TanjilG_00049 [Lupinus angustifolius]